MKSASERLLFLNWSPKSLEFFICFTKLFLSCHMKVFRLPFFTEFTLMFRMKLVTPVRTAGSSKDFQVQKMHQQWVCVGEIYKSM